MKLGKTARGMPHLRPAAVYQRYYLCFRSNKISIPGVHEDDGCH